MFCKQSGGPMAPFNLTLSTLKKKVMVDESGLFVVFTIANAILDELS